jgi:integrase
VCSYRVNKRKRLAKLGRADILTLDQARKKAKEYLGQVAGDRDPQADKDAKWASVTVKELVEAYVTRHAKPKKKTWKNDQSTLRRNLVSVLGARVATSITSGDIEPIHLRIGAEHSYAANTFLEVVRKMFNWASVATLVPDAYKNPTKGIVFFPRLRRRRFITRAEMPRFLQAVEYEENEFARHAVWLLLLTGVRLKELLRAKWEDIDWDLKTLFVGLTKNGEPLLVPLSDAAIDRLQKILRLPYNRHIICGAKPGKPMAGLRKVWLRIRTAARMPDLRIHDVRRTVGSWLVQDGRSLHLVGAVLNHQDTKTTAGYAYFQTEDREQALTAHGQKILAFTANLRGAQDQPLPPECPMVPPPSSVEAIAPARPSYYLPRAELYKLVWERPVVEVAARFGVSDVGLSKICRRAMIPIPNRGYWARLDSGQDVKAKALPPAPKGFTEKIRIRGRTLPRRHTLAYRASSSAAQGTGVTAQQVA